LTVDFPGKSENIIKLECKLPMGPYIELELHNKESNPIDEESSEFVLLQNLGGNGKKRKKRYRNNEWSKLCNEIETSYESYFDIEKKTFEKICQQVSLYRDDILSIFNIISDIDIAISFASVARKYNYVRPEIYNDESFEIIGGRHPVVEINLAKNSMSFQKNNCDLEEKKLWIVTGPNTGGKSVFLRQNALIVIMAQMGSFVPAEYARIGIVDKLFSRVGSSDDLSNNLSSFMLEMTESAFILNHATSKSFVIMDEVGRGTSTLDGMSIAWSIVKYLNHLGCRSLFATHYHELGDFCTQEIPSISCRQTELLSEGDELLFSHRIITGICRNSYGIHCAKLAGLPEPVIDMAIKLYNEKFCRNNCI